MPLSEQEEKREWILKNPLPEWYGNLQEGLFWKECEENFPVAMTGFVQDRPENYENNVFQVKLKEMSPLMRYQ
jgi:hypothetical protein